MANSIISKVYLLDTPLKNDYKDTFYFTSKSAQETYFQGRVKHTFNNVSYLRKEQVIKLNAQYDTISTCNYLMYQNTAYSNKWIYCFIKSMKYISDGVTEIEIETDVIQTYLFDYEVHRSFVEREHVSDDTIGKNTVPENLETGEYTIKDSYVYSELTDTCPVLAMTYDPINDKNAWGSFNSNKYEGLGYYIFKGTLSESYNGADQVTVIKALLDKLADAGKGDSIVSMFMAPRKMVGWDEEGAWSIMKDTALTGTCRDASSNVPSYEPYSFTDFTVDKPTDINGYTPKNNKLFTFPYNYLHLSNNNGGNVVYHYEDFSNKPTFKVKGVLTTSCSIRAIPSNYKNLSENFNEGLSAGKFPVCAWLNDVYTNWLTQNGINIGLQAVSSGMQIIGGAALLMTGGGAMAGASAMLSGSMGIASTLGSVYSHSLIPPQAEGNINSGDISFSANKNTFEAFRIQIKSEYAKIIDDYFDMFGYKVNDVKVPNKNHRSQHWYTKTIDVNITGEIPGTDLQKIKDCYNQGISFWKNPANIYRYDLANGIS